MNTVVTLYEEKKYHIDVALSVFLIIVLTLHYTKVVNGIDAIFLISATALGVLPVFVSAIASVKKKEWASMDMLASVALVFSIVGREWSSAVFISLMLSSARILEEITEKKTRKNINSLLKLRPEKAKVKRGDIVVEIGLEEVKVGDIVLVDTGESVPIDGVIIAGAGAINEASLTGESVPVDKIVGNKAVSGTIVVSGSITVQTLFVGKDTTLEKIIALIEQAEDEKPVVQTMGEKFGKYYLSLVFIVSIVLYLLTFKVALVLSVVLVVCADDIAIAIPIAYLRAIGSAAKHGVVIKGGKHLETLGKIEVIVFDKTGTLTTGKLMVSSCFALDSTKEEELIKFGGIVSRRSNHPLAKAITFYAESRGEKENEPDEADVIEGKGVIIKKDGVEIVLGRETFMKEKNFIFDEQMIRKAETFEDQGESISYIAKDGTVIGFFAAGDTIKKDAKKTVEALYALGIKKVIMLSGDNERVVKGVAEKIGIKDFHANLLPEDKLNKLRELHEHYKVAMVGDGVNDAAALSLSHVGIAMGALGSDTAIESSEIVLMHDNLSAIPRTIQLARDVQNISKQDFGIWIVTNVFGLALALTGTIGGPPGAALYNFISDFFPLLNSVRVKMK